MVDHFRDAGWEAPCVLTGDAAWCATPIAGIGTILAIVGAYVLAGELSQGPSLQQALNRYDEIVRPFVEKGQGVPKILRKTQSRFGVALQHAVQGLPQHQG